MNDHSHIQHLLSPYCGGDLAPEERAAVEKHLSECPACSADLNDLKAVLRIVRTTPEVEPPPWLASRIMVHVREHHTHRQPWWQRLFFPLHLKLPLEAMAVLFVCITGYYLTRTVETGMKSPAIQQDAPSAQPEVSLSKDSLKPQTSTPPPVPESEKQRSIQQKEEIAAPSQPAPSASVTVTEAPVQQNAQQKQQTAASPAPPAPVHFAPAPPSYKPSYKDESIESMGQSMKASPASEADIRVLDAEPEMKKKSSRSTERLSTASAPAAGKSTASTPPGAALPQALIRLNVSDSPTALTRIRESVLRSGGRIIEEAQPSGHRIKTRIPAARINELLELLGKAGKIQERPVLPSGDGVTMLEITIQW